MLQEDPTGLPAEPRPASDTDQTEMKSLMIVRTVQMISRAQVALAPLAVLTQMLIAPSPPNKKHLTPLLIAST